MSRVCLPAGLPTILMACGLLAGCGLKPWVAPYEREYLAEPVMQFSADPLADRHRQHVFEVREGARGAGASQGGGCGCN